jgi:hypothetical protein
MDAEPNAGALTGNAASSYFCGDCDSSNFSIVNQDGTALSSDNSKLVSLTDGNIVVNQAFYIGMTTYRFRLKNNSVMKDIEIRQK